MSDGEDENYVETDSSEDEEQYSKLVNSVSQLDSTQRVKPASRTEVSTEVSEYNLQKSAPDRNLVNINDLANVLKAKTKHVSITNKLKKVTENAQTLPKPLEKTVEDKLKRTIGYEAVQKQLAKWNAVVESNAVKDQLTFPLNNADMKLQGSNDFLRQFKTATPLENEIAKILNQNKPAEQEKEDDEFPLTLEEMLEKRKEMARIRAKLSYREAKAQRQNKIKSKKYHRILKREKLKQQLKEFEILQKTDPTKALEKLEELDKNRALERASLRHRNTGQWAKNLTVKAKYDVESRKILADQLKMSREITQKIHNNDSSDDENDQNKGEAGGKVVAKDLIVAKDNPWSLDVSNEVADFISGYKKYWSEVNSAKEVNGKVSEKVSGKPESNSENSPKKLVNGTVNGHQTSGSPNPTVVNDKSSKKVTKTDEKNVLQNSSSNNSNNSGSSKKKKSGKCKTPEKGDSVLDQDTSSSNETGTVTVRPTSGVWLVTTVTDKEDVPDKTSRKRKGEDINSLFGELDEKLNRKAEKTVKSLNAKLKKEEKREKKKAKTKKEVEEKWSLKGFKSLHRPDVDAGLLEGDEDEVGDSGTGTGDVGAFAEKDAENPEIDPKNFMQIKPRKLDAHIPEDMDVGGEEEDALDDGEEDAKKRQQQYIEEAFGEDDVIAEFQAEKEAEGGETVEVSSSLPGWGEWGGTGILPSKRKKKRFTVKLPPRKDKRKPDMIINEKENPNIKEHMVKSIPHPFKTAEAFESNIRAPVGREWVPETAHHRLIQKPVETKLGTIIEPMGEEEIVKMAKKSAKSPYRGKVTEKKKK